MIQVIIKVMHYNKQCSFKANLWLNKGKFKKKRRISCELDPNWSLDILPCPNFQIKSPLQVSADS